MVNLAGGRDVYRTPRESDLDEVIEMLVRLHTENEREWLEIGFNVGFIACEVVL